MFTSPQLSNQIERLRAEIKDPRAYAILRHNEQERAFEEMSHLRGWWDTAKTHPDETEPDLHWSSRKCRSEAREIEMQLREAWAYLAGLKIGEKKSTTTSLNREALAGINSFLNRDQFAECTLANHTEELARQKELGYRTTRVTFNSQIYSPPKPEKILDMVDALIADLQDSSVPLLERATRAYVGIYAIQPFSAANKRTGRIVQDAILLDAGLPPVVYPSTESPNHYRRLLIAAAGYRDQAKIGMEALGMQAQFHNYTAQKIIETQERIRSRMPRQ